MKEQLEQNRRRLTANEKATVWSNIRDGGASSSRSSWTWLKWATPAAGLATVVLFSLIMADKMPWENPDSKNIPTDMRGDEAQLQIANETAFVRDEMESKEESPGPNTVLGGMDAEYGVAASDSDPGTELRASAAESQLEDASSSLVVQAAPAADSPSLQEDKNQSADPDGRVTPSPPDKAERLRSLGYVGRPSEAETDRGERTLEAPETESVAKGKLRESTSGAGTVYGDELGADDRAGTGSESEVATPPVLNLDEVEVTAERDQIWASRSSKKSDGLKAGEAVTAEGSDQTHDRGGRAVTIPSFDMSQLKDWVERPTTSLRGRSGGEKKDESVKTREVAKTTYDAFAPPIPKPAPLVSGSSDDDDASRLAHGGQTPPNDDVYDGMFFQHYGANPLLLTEMDPLSTFAVDVDTGAYTLMRSYIERGSLPDRNSPRVEEYVNFFDPGYPVFADEDFQIHVDGAPSPFGAGFQLLRVGIQAKTIRDEDRRPTNLTFVIDVSGSMNRENRLGLVKKSLYALLDSLRPEDQVAIVVYGDYAQLVLEPSSVEDGNRIREAIAQLAPNGSTNAEQGLVVGYDIARTMFSRDSNNRVLLCSDGVANVGRTGPDSILERVQSAATEGIYLTTVGFGMGNYNDVLMEQLANKGDGSYYYVDRLEAAERVFTENLTGTLQVIARDAKIQVEFDPEQVLAYRLLGFENREVADKDFRNDSVDAGEIGSGHRVVALYEVRLRGKDLPVEPSELGQVRFRYAEPEADENGSFRVREIEQSLSTKSIARNFESAPLRFRLAAVTAEYSEILRHSYWSQDHTLTELLPFVQDIAFYLRRDKDVTEFAKLVERATKLEEKLTPEERARRWPVLDAVACIYPLQTRGRVDWGQWKCDR